MEGRQAATMLQCQSKEDAVAPTLVLCTVDLPGRQLVHTVPSLRNMLHLMTGFWDSSTAGFGNVPSIQSSVDLPDSRSEPPM